MDNVHKIVKRLVKKDQNTQIYSSILTDKDPINKKNSIQGKKNKIRYLRT
jgi:hypothetical protein